MTGCSAFAIPVGSRGKARVLRRVMSSRLVARAAARSWSRSARPARSCRLSSVSRVICCLKSPMSSGWPRPDSHQACSPSSSERRFSTDPETCAEAFDAQRKAERGTVLGRSRADVPPTCPGPLLPSKRPIDGVPLAPSPTHQDERLSSPLPGLQGTMTCYQPKPSRAWKCPARLMYLWRTFAVIIQMK